MPISLEQLHEEVENICISESGTDSENLSAIAFAIEYSILRQLFRGAVESINNLQVNGFSAPLELTPLTLKLRLNNSGLNILPDIGKKLFKIDRVKAFFDICWEGDPTRVIRTFEINLDNIWADIVLDPNSSNLHFAKHDIEGPTNMTPSAPPDDDVLRLAYTIEDIDPAGNPIRIEDPDRLNKYTDHELLIKYKALSGIADFILKSIPLPPIVRGMNTFKLDAPLKVHYGSEYLIITTQMVELLAAACPFVLGGSPPAPSTLSLPPDPLRPNFCIVLPRTIIKRFSFDRVKPAFGPVPYHDWGWGVAWGYYATAYLRRLDLILDAANKKLRISAPFDIRGHAFARIEIECIKYEVLSADVEGAIDPLEFSLVVALDPSTKKLLLCVVEENIDTSSITLSQRNTFPLDLIAEALLGDFRTRMMKREVSDRIRALFSVSLFDFEEFKIRQRIEAVFEHIRDKSVLYGVLWRPFPNLD